VYNAAWINDENTSDSLLIPQRAQEVGITFSTEDPSEESAMRIGNEGFPFQNNTRELFFNISKPSEADWRTLPWYKLNFKKYFAPDIYRFDERGRKMKRNGQLKTP
jgi:hypothetical protein